MKRSGLSSYHVHNAWLVLACVCMHVYMHRLTLAGTTWRLTFVAAG